MLSLVWGTQTFYFIFQFLFVEEAAFNPLEGLFLYAWLVVTLSLVIHWLVKVDFVIFFTNLVGFIMMAFSLFSFNQNIPTEMQELLSSELLWIHISFIFLAYAAFTLAFACSIMYIILHHMLKRKKWNKRLQRFGSLHTLNQFAFLATLIAAPLLIVGLIQGMVWASVQLEYFYWFDSKVITSIITLLIYLYFLYNRMLKNRTGYDYALLNVIAFIVLVMNYWLSGQFSNFHLW